MDLWIVNGPKSELVGYAICEPNLNFKPCKGLVRMGMSKLMDRSALVYHC